MAKKKLEMEEEEDDSDDEPFVGGITEVEGSHNCPTIDSLARFAVDQHNKEHVTSYSLRSYL